MHFRRSAPAQPDPRGPVREHDYFGSAVGWLTCQIIAYRFTLENERRARMDRVTEKLKQAAGVAARSNAGLEAEADKLIAREAEFEKRKVQAFKPHYAVLDSRHREMDQLEDALKVISNADPLDGSGDGLDGQEQSEPEPGKIAVEPLRPGMTPADTMKWVDQGQQEVAGEASLTFPAV